MPDLTATIQYETGGVLWHDKIAIPAADLMSRNWSVCDWLIENTQFPFEWELVDVTI